jgi:hypothetical protein
MCVYMHIHTYIFIFVSIVALGILCDYILYLCKYNYLCEWILMQRQSLNDCGKANITSTEVETNPYLCDIHSFFSSICILKRKTLFFHTLDSQNTFLKSRVASGLLVFCSGEDIIIFKWNTTLSWKEYRDVRLIKSQSDDNLS